MERKDEYFKSLFLFRFLKHSEEKKGAKETLQHNKKMHQPRNI